MIIVINKLSLKYNCKCLLYITLLHICFLFHLIEFINQIMKYETNYIIQRFIYSIISLYMDISTLIYRVFTGLI